MKQTSVWEIQVKYEWHTKINRKYDFTIVDSENTMFFAKIKPDVKLITWSFNVNQEIYLLLYKPTSEKCAQKKIIVFQN